ncbi:MAG: di-trans,poly-cis-decaprenylcistransferase, partial [Methanobacteriota archaeon]
MPTRIQQGRKAEGGAPPLTATTRHACSEPGSVSAPQPSVCPPVAPAVLAPDVRLNAESGSSCQPSTAAASGARAHVRLEAACLPQHIAVVMDGNGRWAKQRGAPRTEGHVAGVSSIHRLIRACRRLGIPYLTLYAFSAQNWSRPPEEVHKLMTLLMEFVRTDCQELVANGVRLLVTGDIDKLPAGARHGLVRLIDASKGNRDLTLCLALSYGGREEIVQGVTGICAAVQAGHMRLADITVDSFRTFMPNPDVPDPDLLIRTSGELRVSNFLLWQIAYTELYVTPLLWPDFDDAALMDALAAYATRQRRFGKTGDQITCEAAAVACAPTSESAALARGAGDAELFGAVAGLTQSVARSSADTRARSHVTRDDSALGASPRSEPVCAVAHGSSAMRRVVSSSGQLQHAAQPQRGSGVGRALAAVRALHVAVCPHTVHTTSLLPSRLPSFAAVHAPYTDGTGE